MRIENNDVHENEFIKIMLETNEKPLLLLIEDNYIALRIVETLASKAGCYFISTAEGEHALTLAQTLNFNLIITDVRLPTISGPEFTRLFREWEETYNKAAIPIVGLTAHTREQAKDECLQAGMNDVFTKPISLLMIKKIVRQFVLPKESSLPQTMPLSIGNLGKDLPNLEKQLFELETFPLLDCKNAIESMGSDMVRKILYLMKDQEIPNNIINLQKYYTQKNWSEIEKLAHTMKSVAVYCGTIRMKYACQYLERYQKTGRRVFLKKLYQQLMEVTEETKRYIERWLEH